MRVFFAVLAAIFIVSTGAMAQPAVKAPVDAAAATAAAPAKFVPSVTNVIGEAHDWYYGFQPDVTELSHHMQDFHTYLLYIISAITIVVMALIAYIIFRFRASKNPVPSKTTHNTLLEVIWTVIPIIIIVIIIVPSIKLLYYSDRVEKADLTVKIIGYQWYWSYELPDQKVAEFESRVIPEAKLQPGQRRLMDVDEPLLLPVGKVVRILTTGDPNGVIHAWGVAGLSYKRDAIPGRINEGWLKIDKPGIYYGDCYQLCGVDHAFMPIKVIGVSEEEFNRWVISKGGQPAANQNEVTVSSSNPGKHESDAALTTKPEATAGQPAQKK